MDIQRMVDILKKLNIDNLSNKSDSTIIDSTFPLNDKIHFYVCLMKFCLENLAKFFKGGRGVDR